MVTYIYFVKCPNCEDEHFDFFDDAKGFALGCLSKKPIITQTEVCRNDFGECTDSSDLGTIWSWEDEMKDTETEEPVTNVFNKGDFGEYNPDNDPELADDNFFAVNNVTEEWDPDDYDSPEEAADAYADMIDTVWDSRYDKGLDELDRPLPEYRYVYDETTGKYKHILVNKDVFTQDELRRFGELEEAVTAGISFKNSADLAEFKKLCDEIGILTIGDVKNFMRETGANDANILDKLRAYRDELGADFEIKECARKPVPEGMTIEQLVEEMEENEDEVECTWCNDLFPKDMCHKEVNLGWLCSRCADGIMSRGESLTFKENNYWDFLDEKFDIDFEDEASSDMLDAEADEFAEFDLDYPEID